MKKCIILFSGGLDSRLALKIIQKQGFEIIAIYFKLPFLHSCLKDVREFLKQQKTKLKIFDCAKGKLLKEYLDVIKKAEHGRGAGVNPCIDCRIFMFKKAKEFADKKRIDLIVSGEVLNQRPMSQRQKQMKIIEEESGAKGRIYRPLIEMGISGRQRKKQITLAKKFKIKYPSPAGGCLLCEKYLKKRFEKLFKRGLNEKEIPLIGIGRHFFIDNCWIILGRNQQENEIIEKSKTGKIILPKFSGPSAIILGSRTKFQASSLKNQERDKPSKKIRDKTNELIQAYSKKGNLKDRKKFENFKI